MYKSFINEKVKKILDNEFDNVTYNYDNITFGKTYDNENILKIKFFKVFNTVEIVITKRHIVGNCNFRKIIFSKEFIRSEFKREMIETIFDDKEFIAFLKRNNKVIPYVKETFKEEEKDGVFDTKIITLKLEGRFDEFRKLLANNCQKYIYSSNDSSKDIDDTFATIAFNLDRNTNESIYDRFGFDVYDFRKQILKTFFEERPYSENNTKEHFYVFKNFN